MTSTVGVVPRPVRTVTSCSGHCSATDWSWWQVAPQHREHAGSGWLCVSSDECLQVLAAQSCES